MNTGVQQMPTTNGAMTWASCQVARKPPANVNGTKINYCNEAASYDIKMPALDWWLQDTQRRRWPQLSRWAIEILSVPSMSDKPERIFSGGRRRVTWDKTSMTAATLERLECARDWKRDDLLKDDF